MNRVCTLVGDVCRTVMGACVVVVILPVVGVVVMILWAWRCLALLAVMFLHRRKAHAASGMEALFALDSEQARAVITAAAVLRGKVSVDTVHKLMSERVLEVRDARGRYAHPKFRQVVEKRCGVVVWMEEENFDSNSHVRELLESGRPRVLVDEMDLVNVAGSRTNMPFVRGHARWEILVAPLAKFRDDSGGTEGHTAVLVRLHHCLGDGRSLVGVLVTALAEPSPVQPRVSPVARHHQGGCLARVARLIWAVSNLPWVVARVLRRGDNSLLHGPRLAGHKMLAWSVPLPLPALKAGRALAGVSVNDLLLTGVAQALHRYLECDQRSAPAYVMTVLPVDVTAPGTPLSLANRISLCTFPLPTGVMSPQNRLERVHKVLTKLKCSPDVLVNYMALSLITNLLPAPLARRALNTHGVTMVASNLPGPPETVHLFGKEVVELMFWIPNKSRTGIGVSMLSYRGQVRLGINVDSALVPTQTQAQYLIDQAAASTAQILLDVIKQKQEQQSEYEEGEERVHQIVSQSTDEYSDSLHEPTIPCFRFQASSQDSSRDDEDLPTANNFGFYFSEDQLLLCHGRGMKNSAGEQYRAHSDTHLQHGYLGHPHQRFALSDIHLPLPNP